MDIHKIINFSELSRHITGGDRSSLRLNKIPKKYIPMLDQFFYHDLPDWWTRQKQNIKS